MEENRLLSKARSVLMGAVVGDALGAAVEGYCSKEILAASRGVGISHYREAHHMGDPKRTPRYGMYTDDTNKTLALADALVKKGRVDAKAISLNYGIWYVENKPTRFCPSSAMALLTALYKSRHSNPDHFKKIWKQDSPFERRCPGGSFANGGMMRISPIGIVYGVQLARDTQAALAQGDEPQVGTEFLDNVHEGVRSAIMATHTHPLAVDGSFVHTLAIVLLMQGREFVIGEYKAQVNGGLLKTGLFRGLIRDQEDFFSSLQDEFARALLSLLYAHARHPDIRRAVVDVAKIFACKYKSMSMQESDVKVVEEFTQTDSLVADDRVFETPIFEDSFRMKSSDSVRIVLFAFCRWYQWPKKALTNTISLGGDTDTIASMTGALLGASQNSIMDWILPHLVNELENSPSEGPGNIPNGRDFILDVAARLVAVDGVSIINT